MPARTFAAEGARFDALALGERLHAVLIGHALAIVRVLSVAAVPDREDDAALGGRIHLHAEVTARESARHVVSRDRVFDGGHFVVKPCDFRVLRRRIHEMHRGGVAARVEIEVRIRCGGPVEHERVEVAGGLPHGVERREFDAHIACFRDRKFAARHGLGLAGAGRGNFVRLLIDGAAQPGRRILRQPQNQGAIEFSGRL